jgi:hypothetical protein
MIRFTMRSIAVLVLSLALLSALAAPTLAAPGGNSAMAAACEDGGYLGYTDDDGNAFKNAGQCTRYATQGGTLVAVQVMPDLFISGGLITFGGVISGTGFTPSTSLTILMRVYSESGVVLTALYSASTDAYGAFTTSNDYDYWFCFSSANTGVEITATDAADISHTKFFALSCPQWG